MRGINFKYSLLMAAYWGSVCCATGFSSTFLLDRGFSSTMIGIAMALGNILAVVASPKVSAIADRSKKIKVHHLVIISSILFLLCFLVLFAVRNSFIVTFVFFFLSVTMMQILQPLTNSVSVYYINRGIDINFGVPRAMGSMCYGIISTLLGIVTVKLGTNVIPASGIIVAIVLIAAMLMFPVLEDKDIENKDSVSERKVSDTGFFEFIRKYPGFLLMMIGIVFLFIFQTLSNNYLMQLAVAIGGDASTIGYALTCQAVIELPPMILFTYFLKKFGSVRLLIFSAIFWSIKAAGFMIVREPVVLYLVMFLQMLAYAVYIPASVAYVNEVVEYEDQFKGQAMVTSASTLGAMLGALLGGVLIDSVGVFATQKIDFVISLIGTVIIVVTLLPKLKSANKTN